MNRKARDRFIGGTAAGLAMAAILAAQQNPAAPAAPAGGGRGGRGAAAAAPAGGRGGARGGFTQFTRPLADQDALVRGQTLYESTCASCHASDLRGSANGLNLLRSGVALNDQRGEGIAASVAAHSPGLTLVAADSLAIAEYIHSILSTTGRQGSPPGGAPGIGLNVLVGDAKAGEAYFAKGCASCHSVSGDMKGIGGKYPEARDLQNAWVGGGRGGATASQATVTMADGSKVQGRLVRKDDFLIVLTLEDGSRRSIARSRGIPKVDVVDPKEAHKKMALELDDPANKNMHDVTAYLASLK